MSVFCHFAALATGGRPSHFGLLGNCRLEWCSGEAYGEEAILELFRLSPFDPGQDAVLIQTDASAAWIGCDGALVADLYDGRIGRLWRVGDGSSPEPEPEVSVAFDPDLRQQRGDILMRADDHPELTDVIGVVAAGKKLLTAASSQPLHRARAFAVRAFTGEKGTAALFAVHRLTGGATRSGGFAFAAAIVGGLFVADHAPKRPWTPRL